MAETEPVLSKRDAYLTRLKKKYPDKKFEQDDEIFDQAGADYDEYEGTIEKYKGREKELSDMFAQDPRSARFLTDMARGQDPVVGLVRNFGVEIKDVLDDPDKQEEIAEANREYVERVARNKSLEEEYNRNLDQTLETLRGFQQQKGMSDEEIDDVVELLLGIVRDGVMGKFSPQALEMACKAINHDADVQAAGEEGEIAGRNAKIEERLRRRQKGDGTQPLGGKNGAAGGGAEPDMFALANQAI